MSGGLYNYLDSSLMNEIFGWNDIEGTVPNVFEDREISELTYDLLSLIHEYDWYKSGDKISKNTWILKQSLKGNGLIIVE